MDATRRFLTARVDEVRVLAVKRLLQLVEHSLLVLGEWHLLPPVVPWLDRRILSHIRTGTTVTHDWRGLEADGPHRSRLVGGEAAEAVHGYRRRLVPVEPSVLLKDGHPRLRQVPMVGRSRQGLSRRLDDSRRLRMGCRARAVSSDATMRGQEGLALLVTNAVIHCPRHVPDDAVYRRRMV